MRITAKLLRTKKACEIDVEIFETQWPKGCNVTRKNCKIAFRELGMSVGWAIGMLLPRKAQIECTDAGDKVCRECNIDRDCPDYCEYGKVRIEAFYQAAKG